MSSSTSSKNASNTPHPSLGEPREAFSHIRNAKTSLDRIQSHLDQASTLAEQGACSALFAHEVNNLMTQVGGRAQLAMFHRDQPELTTKALELAIHASRQIAELARSLMSINESESVTQPVGPAAHADTANASIAQIHQQTLAYIAQNDISAFRFEIDHPQLARTLLAPSVVLGQVLLNLYLNAIRAIEESGHQHKGIIAIRLLTVQDQLNCSTGNNLESGLESGNEHLQNEHIQIIIEDTGVGMPQHIVESLAQGNTKQQSSGSHQDQINTNHPRHGYGLKISQDLLAQVGGSLAAESIIGQGTKMTITLPIEHQTPAA